MVASLSVVGGVDVGFVGVLELIRVGSIASALYEHDK